jgi:uncharacterized protein (TIGR03382 family)
MTAPVSAAAGECSGGLCGTPDQSGGGCGCGCGCGSILVAMTDRGDTYQFADDFDGDGIEDEFDNCAFGANYDQADTDADGVGDACDVCLTTADPEQIDIDADGAGDACDPDIDGDGVPNGTDNCQQIPNAAQVNTDNDVDGDACDADDDNDGIDDVDDDCRLGTAGVDVCDDDADGDGIATSEDNCPNIYNAQLDGNGLQLDMDQDGLGDLCDLDMDGDDVPNFGDNCMGVYNPSQIDSDFDGLGDAGDWTGGAESCDAHECYVIAGDTARCLDPSSAFAIYLNLVGERIDGALQVDHEVTVALFSNRLGQLHNWTARLSETPSDSATVVINAKGAGATLEGSPQVANCLETDSDGNCTELNNIRFTPDAPGTYVIKVNAELPHGDNAGPDTATYTIIAEVDGEAKGGCAAAGGVGAFGVMALGLLVAVRRKRK